MPRVLALLSMLTACNPPDVVDTDTDAAVDTDPAPAARIILGGSYAARLLKKSNNTCGMSFALLFEPTDCDLIWGGSNTFDLFYPEVDTTTSCSVDDEKVTCAGYTQDADISHLTPSGPSLLKLVAEIPTFDVISNTSFENSEAVTINCEGDGCAQLIEDHDIPAFPCGLDIAVAYAQ